MNKQGCLPPASRAASASCRLWHTTLKPRHGLAFCSRFIALVSTPAPLRFFLRPLFLLLVWKQNTKKPERLRTFHPTEITVWKLFCFLFVWFLWVCSLVFQASLWALGYASPCLVHAMLGNHSSNWATLPAPRHACWEIPGTFYKRMCCVMIPRHQHCFQSFYLPEAFLLEEHMFLKGILSKILHPQVSVEE